MALLQEESVVSASTFPRSRTRSPAIFSQVDYRNTRKQANGLPQEWSRVTCGKGGARLAARLGVHTSRQTLLRRIMALPDPPLGSILYLGIDDFSFRRGGQFGTILVNLESHRVVDLLPDRKAETAAAWMRKLPELMVVSRDRGGEYASAAAQGAPQAIQCADRFHLLKNLREAGEGLLAHHLAAQRKRQTQVTREQSAPVWRPKRAARPSPQGGASSAGQARGASGPLRAGDRLTSARAESAGHCPASGHWSQHRQSL